MDLNTFTKQAFPCHDSHYEKLKVLHWQWSSHTWDMNSANMMQHILLSSKDFFRVCHKLCHKTIGTIHASKLYVLAGNFCLALLHAYYGNWGSDSLHVHNMSKIGKRSTISGSTVAHGLRFWEITLRHWCLTFSKWCRTLCSNYSKWELWCFCVVGS